MTLDFQEDYGIYKDIIRQYHNLQEGDYGTAFNLEKSAESHAARIGELLHEYEKLYNDSKVDAEATRCRVSIADDAKNTTKGNRHAATDEQYITAVKLQNNYKRFCGYLEIAYRRLENVSYRCYTIIDSANKRGRK